MKLEEVMPDLQGRSLFITGTGKRMRDIAQSPGDNGVVMQIDDSGSVCTYWSPGVQQVAPSSEQSR